MLLGLYIGCEHLGKVGDVKWVQIFKSDKNDMGHAKIITTQNKTQMHSSNHRCLLTKQDRQTTGQGQAEVGNPGQSQKGTQWQKLERGDRGLWDKGLILDT